jgi:uncharacterized protein (TIGR03492 family)
MPKLLCLSNGHGEDEIAVQILDRLKQQPNPPQMSALPLVGEGYAYTKAGIPLAGDARSLPSGGFIYMDGKQFWRDLRGGLLKLTAEQYQSILKWGGKGNYILAVGDIVPSIFAYLSGANYAFVGTAKSEYYIRDEDGWLPQTPQLSPERSFGSVYLPWERWLMSHRRCRAVFPRDSLTTKILQKFSIPAYDLGNPMMDGLSCSITDRDRIKTNLSIVLLPGSRSPEALNNWRTILKAVTEIVYRFSGYELVFFAAIAPALDRELFAAELLSWGWLAKDKFTIESIEDPQALYFKNYHATLVLSQNAYRDCLLNGDVAIAMAGTATEQFVGLGKLAITIAGEGPQFTPAFAEAQARLLGCSTIFLDSPEKVPQALQTYLKNPDRWQLVRENGKRRMGSEGAAERIAQCLQAKLLAQNSKK